MRVTERMRWMRTQSQLESTVSKGDVARQQALTGKRVNVASDDITAHQASQRLNAHAARQQAFMDNARDVGMELERKDGAINQSHNLMSSARELSVQFGDASYGADEMAGAVNEVNALKDAMVRIANADHLGRALFGGVRSADNVVDGSGTYVGSGSARAVTVGEGTSVAFQTAEEVFGPIGDSAFDALDAFSAALSSGDSSAVRAAQAGLDEALDRMEGALQQVGSNMTTVDEAMVFAEQMNFLNETQSASLTQADFVQAISTMEQSSTVYELSLKIASEQKQLTRSILSL